MPTSRFQKAARKQLKLRCALAGPAGSGKTYTALRFAFALGKRIAVICTEHGAAQKYAGLQLESDGTAANFDVVEPNSFSPSEYTSLIDEAGAAKYDVVVIDSLSHAWEGKDGALELVDKVDTRNRFTAWKDVSPMHRRLVESILGSPCHVIATMRSKQEYVLQEDGNGKSVPIRVGMKPIQREGMEYEFDVFGDLDLSHIFKVTKTRCPTIDGATVTKPGAAFIQPVIRWLETGEAAAPATVTPRVTDATLAACVATIAELGLAEDKVRKELVKRYAVTELRDMREENGKEFFVWLGAQLKRNKKPAATTPATPPPTATAAAATAAAAAAETNGTSHGAGQGSSAPPTGVATPTAANGTAPAATTTPPPQNKPGVPGESAARNDHPLVVEVRRLVAELKKYGLTEEQWRGALHRAGAPSEIDLTDAQCQEFIAKLTAKLQAATAADTANANTKGGEAATSAAGK
jgi:hypothetical protein